MRLTTTSALLLLAPTSFSVAGDLHVVGAGSDADFATIQAAVDVAVDGDAVLVRNGSYEGFTVHDKEVAVFERPGHTVVVDGGVLVTNLAAHKTVVLSGIDVLASRTASTPAVEALVVSACAGGVRVQDGVLRGADGLQFSFGQEHGGAGAHVANSQDVSFSRVELRGGNGELSFGGYDDSQGGYGVFLDTSSVMFHECLVHGGNGGNHDVWSDSIEGYAGHGLAVEDATLVLHGSVVIGGDSGRGDGVFCLPGGHGLWLLAGARAFLLDDRLEGGHPGITFGGCSDGEPLRLEAGAWVRPWKGEARTFATANATVAGGTWTGTFGGEPGDTAWVLSSTVSGWNVLPAKRGGLLVGDREGSWTAAIQLQLAGVVPAGGELTTALPAPSLPPGSSSEVLRLQALFVGVNGRSWIATPSTVVVLE